MVRKSAAALLVLSAVVFLCARAARADDLDPAQIKAILKVPTAADGDFVDRVIIMVNRGTLPRDMFQSTLQWARKKGKNRFQFFKRALILRAADAGIIIPG